MNNILRKKRKNNRKIRLRRYILLIFSLIMTTFAWFTYSKILNTGVQIHINSWDISFFVDENGNNIAEASEEQENPIAVDLSDLYPGMEEKIIKVIIKNNGETPTDILYTCSKINILGNDYSWSETVPTESEYYILKNDPIIGEGIMTTDFINEPQRFPFKITIEHTQEILARGTGYLTIKVSWPLYNEDDTDEEKERKDILDTEWGYKVAKYLEDNADNPDVTGAFLLQLRINAIGKPRTDYSEFLTADITPANYGDYIDYSIDLNGDGNTTNDWRIFYNNGNNVYLIAADYLKNSMMKDGVMSKTTSGNYSKYGIFWNEDRSDFHQTNITPDIISKFLFKKAIPTTEYNYQAMGNLLNTDNWNNLVDEKYAESAIGSPTVEMFMNSWNQKYAGNSNYSQLSCAWVQPDGVTFNSPGYAVGTTVPNDVTVTVKGYNRSGNNEDLYWPYTSGAEDKTYSWWLASPSASLPINVLRVTYNGKILGNNSNSRGMGIRPIVALKSNAMAEQIDGVWRLDISDLIENVTYSRVETGLAPVTVTIELNKEILLPDGWEYADSEKKSINKTYSENTREKIVLTDTEGYTTLATVKVDNIKADENALISKVYKNGATYYGDYTDYPIDIDGDETDNDWRIFYTDGNHVYLIADDYVRTDIPDENHPINLALEKAGMSKANKYSTSYWRSDIFEKDLTINTNSKFLTKKVKHTISLQQNYKAAAGLLNTTYWQSLTDTNRNGIYTDDLADDAVGAPTLEMFTNSWNEKYLDNGNYSQIKNAWVEADGSTFNSDGYAVGTTIADKVAVKANGYNGTENDENLYWPHTEKIDSEKAWGYWIASPSSENKSNLVFASYGGFLSANDCQSLLIAIRPVISLKSGVKGINTTDALGNTVWELTLD